jgi:hypothetical protein
MSDVTVADGGAPAPASNETVIDQNPVNPPQPVGSQAPEKPAEAPVKSGPEARREAIQRAFDRANNPKDAKAPQRPAPKAAEAKPGHNQPPEPTLDLKKRPADQPQQHREQGRFARAPDAQQPGSQQPAKPHAQLPETAPYREPPPRMAEHAKRDWATAPESVRGEVHRMAKETETIYRQYRGSHDAFQPVARFHQMAQQHGTTLERALTNYVSMEQKLRADPVGGLDVIINNLNLRTSDGQKLTLRDVAYHVLSQSPEQLKMIQQGNMQQAASHQIGALHQEIAGLKQTLHQMHTQQQFTYTRSAVDQFAETHPRFDELGTLIEAELKFGFDLETAYRRAELLRPTPAAQTRAPPAQTRTADKSISGSPDVAPSNGASRSQKPVGRREAIGNAIRRVNGGL